jgi:hypothetical protein
MRLRRLDRKRKHTAQEKSRRDRLTGIAFDFRRAKPFQPRRAKEIKEDKKGRKQKARIFRCGLPDVWCTRQDSNL